MVPFELKFKKNDLPCTHFPYGENWWSNFFFVSRTLNWHTKRSLNWLGAKCLFILSLVWGYKSFISLVSSPYVMGSCFCVACAGLTVRSSKRKSRQVRNGGEQPPRNIYLLFHFYLLNEIPELITYFVIFSVYNNSEIFGNGLGCYLCVPFIWKKKEAIHKLFSNSRNDKLLLAWVYEPVLVCTP